MNAFSSGGRCLNLSCSAGGPVCAELSGSSIPKGEPTMFEAPTQKQCFQQVFTALGTAGDRAKVRLRLVFDTERREGRRCARACGR